MGKTFVKGGYTDGMPPGFARSAETLRRRLQGSRYAIPGDAGLFPNPRNGTTVPTFPVGPKGYGISTPGGPERQGTLRGLGNGPIMPGRGPGPGKGLGINTPALWPPPDMSNFDPGMGRGYRLGAPIAVPAGAGFGGIPPACLVNHGDGGKIFRWKITFNVTDPYGNDPGFTFGSRLRFVALGKMESDEIPRRCSVSLGDAQVMYAPGRTLQLYAFNPMDFDLVANFSIDEATAGLQSWEDVEFLSLVPGDPEIPLDIPPFCDNISVVWPQDASFAISSLILHGYNSAGIDVVHAIAPATVGRIDHRRIAGLDYTVEYVVDGSPTQTNPLPVAVSYLCVG